MADDDLTSLIRERQRKAECEAAGIPYVQDVMAVREAAKCDPELPATPDIMLEASPAPGEEPPVRELPKPLIVRSPAVTVVCEVGTGSAESAYGESTIEMYLDDVPEITRAELYRIADNRAALQAALDNFLEPLASGSITEAAFDAEIMAASTVEATAAVGVRLRALELRGSAGGVGGPTGLYAIAELTAMSRLVCTFASPAIWVVCDSSQESGVSTRLSAPVPPLPASRFRHRSAGFAVSEISVNDAIDLAVRDAISDPTFSCIYLNDPAVVTCADIDPAFALTYSPPFAWNGNNYTTLAALGAAGFHAYSLDSLAAQNTLVYSVPTGVFSASTQAEANARAREAALAQLNCFFPSRAAVVDCANRSADNPVTQRMASQGMTKEQVFAEMDAEYSVLDPSRVTNYGILPLSPGPGADIDTSEGLRVAMPAGMVISQVSTAEADDEARAHALGFLSCFWVSPEVTCSCVAEAQVSPAPGSYWRTNQELIDLKAPLNVDSSTGVLTFAKGALGSSEDGFIPVSDSMALCKASLVCVYCNLTIEPRCSVRYIGAVGVNLWDGDDEDLPLSLTSKDGVSSGISAGLPANLICDSDPELVNTLAVSTGSIPPLINGEAGDPICRYGNRELSKTCVEKVGALAYGLTPESESRSVTVAAGSFEAENQVDADQLAQDFLNASLVCEFGNPPMIVRCGATANVQTISAGEYVSAVTYGSGENVIAPTAVGGVATPLSVGAHVFTSLESPLNAKAQALLSMVTQLDCFWRNARVDLRCGAARFCPTPSAIETATITSGSNPDDCCPDSNGDVLGEVFVDRYVVTSYASQEEANAQAYEAAYNQLDCFWQNATIALRCGAAKGCPTPNTPETGTISSGNNHEDCSAASFGATAGQVGVSSKSVTSYTSQAEANRAAYAEAYLQLDCFWENANIDLMCTAPPTCPSDLLDTPENGSIQQGDNSRDNHPESNGDTHGEVNVSRQTFASYSNQAEANRQAYAMAYSMLDCFWKNAQIELMCDASPVCPTPNIPEGGTIQEGSNLRLFSASSNGALAGQVSLDRNSIISYISQADANNQAYASVWPQLDCFWESARMELACGAPVVCPTPRARETSTIRAPWIANPEDCCPHSTGDVHGEVFLERQAISSYQSQESANAQAYQMAYEMLDCFWENAHIVVLCGAPPVCPLPNTPENGNITAGKGVGYSEKSNGFKPTDIVVPTATVISYESQVDANYQAYEIGYPQLDCFWLSAKIDLLCNAPPFCPPGKVRTNEHGTITEGSNRFTERLGQSTYSDQSTGFKLGDAMLPAETIQSYVSQADANNQAYSMVWPQLDCFWHNAKMRVWCTPSPTLANQFRLYGPNGWVDSGSGPVEDPVVVAARDVQSYRNQEDANVRAYFQAKDQLICQSDSHPFALSASPTFACCKTKFDRESASLEESKLYSPNGGSLSGSYPGYDVIDPKLAAASACSFYPAYFYLEARLEYESYYKATSAEIVVSKIKKPLLEGSEGSYTKVRRLIAEVRQDDSGSAFNADARDLCGGIRIYQSVTTAQKLVTTMEGDKEIPKITDFDSPNGGGPTEVCGNLKVFTRDGQVMVGIGQIGTTMIAEESMGTVNSLKGGVIYAHVTLDGTDGTYTAEAINGNPSEEGSETEFYMAIGAISATGAVTQMACGPIGVSVCRNWFTATSPYYAATLSSYG